MRIILVAINFALLFLMAEIFIEFILERRKEGAFSDLWKMIRRSRVERRIEEQWPDALLFISSALRAGLSLEEALVSLQNEAPEPLRSLLERKLGGSLGMSLPARLHRIFDKPSLALVRAALLLSHEAGGKVAGILDRSAEIQRKKIMINQKMNTLTAQGRASAWIVGSSPFGLLLCFSMFSTDYVRPLFQTRAGLGILSLVVLMILGGFIMIHRMSSLEP